MKIPMREKNFGDPPYPPKKADFGRTKAKIGRFLTEGIVLQFWNFAWAPNSQNMKIPMKKTIGGHPSPPKKADFGRTKAKIGRFSQKVLCYSFEILQGLLSNKNIRIPMKIKFRGPPLPP